MYLQRTVIILIQTYRCLISDNLRSSVGAIRLRSEVSCCIRSVSPRLCRGSSRSTFDLSLNLGILTLTVSS